MNLPTRENIFISYSHIDKLWLEKLQIVLNPLIRKEKITIWDDTQISPGATWYEEINKAIASSKIAVLLVSSNFLASDFIIQHELKPILNAAKKEGLIILWIAVGASLYEETEIASYQAINNPSKPLESLIAAEVNKELVMICKKIIQVVRTHHPDVGNIVNGNVLSHKPTPNNRDERALLNVLSSNTTQNLQSKHLSRSHLHILARSLMQCPCISDSNAREMIVRQLSDDIQYIRIKDPRQDVDIQNLVDTCNNYPGGLESLIDVIRRYDGGTWQMKEVDNILNTLISTFDVKEDKSG